MHYLYLAAAIICEVAGTSALKESDGMTRLLPSVIVVVGYALAFFLLSLTLRSIPVGIAYAIWSGAGIVLISLVGLIWFKQSLDFAAIAGMAMIIAGVAVIYTFSATAGR